MLLHLMECFTLARHVQFVSCAGHKYKSRVIACVQNVASPAELSCYIVNLDITADIAHVETMCVLFKMDIDGRSVKLTTYYLG